MICPALTVIANEGKDAIAYKIGMPKATLILLGLLASQNIAPDYFIISAAIFPFGILFIVTSFLGYLNHKDSSGKLIASAPAFINIGGALGPAIMGGILINYTLILVGFVVIFIYSLASILVYLKK